MFFRCTSNFSGFPKEDAAWQAHGPCTTCWDGATGQGTLQVYAACCHPLECEGPVKAWSSEQRPADQRSWVNWIKRGEPTRLTQILENRPKALMIIQHALTLTGGVQSLPWRAGEMKFPILAKLVKALLSLFTGPLVEGSFNIMDDIIENDRVRPNIEMYEGFAII